jgi:hypothetical protein
MKYMVEKATRLEILKYYHDKGLMEYTQCREFIDIFDISIKELKEHIQYLKEKGYIDCFYDFDEFAICRITVHGMDVIENPEQFVSEFPALNLIIHGDVYDSQILQGKNIKIANSLNRVYRAIEESDMNPTDKKELSENVDKLKLEAGKKNPDNSRIKSILDTIKSKNPYIYNLINPLVVEYLKKAIGLD